MGRLRASLARSDIDRELHLHLGNAGREVQRALDICVRVARGRGADESYSPAEVRRARQYADALRRARDMMSQVGHLTPSIDLSDPDLTPEALKRPPERPAPAPAPVVDEQGEVI